MRKVIIIGTLHAGSTPNVELQEVLEKYKPDRLLVEIAQSDIKRGKIRTYPPEMRFAYYWALRNEINVIGFDSKIAVFAKGKTQRDNKKAIRDQEKVLKNFDWKDMNKESNLKLLDVKSAVELVDPKKEKKRERELLINLRRGILKKGTTVVVTGCGHLANYEKHIENAVFPFR